MRFSIIPAAILGLCVASTSTAEVTVELGGGSIVVTGELLAVEDGIYVIRTAIGDIRMPADMVTCDGEDCPVPEEPISLDVRVVTPPAFLGEVLPKLVTAYAAENDLTYAVTDTSDTTLAGALTLPDGENAALIDIKTGDDTAAFAALLAGEAEFILTERRISPAEVASFNAAGFGDMTAPGQEHIFGEDATTLVLSDLNPVEAISLEQAAAIFAGDITNWSELGGLALPIKAYAPAPGTSTATFFEQRVLGSQAATFADRIDRTVPETDIAAMVQADPFAIGVTSLTHADAARAAALDSTCGIRVVADDFTVRAEDYPLVRRFYIYNTNRAVSPAVPALIALLQSDLGQAIMGESGFINLTTQKADLNSFGQRLAYALSSPALDADIPNLRDFASAVLNADRLSTTFRFAPGSTALDNKARADVLRLAKLLQTPQYTGAEVMLIGFTDSDGSTELNTTLSQQRAAQVATDIVEIAAGALTADQITTFGFGATNPVACNTDAIGQDLNRRVEVWIR